MTTSDWIVVAVMIGICVLLGCGLGGCASVPPAAPIERTITRTVTVPTFPPVQLYSEIGPCKLGEPRVAGNVRDLVNVLIDERLALMSCLADRAALRKWVTDNGGTK